MFQFNVLRILNMVKKKQKSQKRVNIRVITDNSFLKCVGPITVFDLIYCQGLRQCEPIFRDNGYSVI